MIRTLNMMAAVLMIGLSEPALTQDTAPAPHKQHRGSSLTPDEKADKMTERMVQELKLDEMQRGKVSAINVQMVRDMEMLKQQRSEDRKERVRVVRDQYDRDLKAVLTAEQYQRLQQLRAERAAKQQAKKQQRQARPAAPGPEPQR